MIKLPPLFALEIVILDNIVFDYNTSIPKFEEVTTNAIDYCIKSLQNIPQLHTLIMEKLKWNKILNITTVQLHEALVNTLKSKVQVLFGFYLIFLISNKEFMIVMINYYND